ncbi:MAG TPA: MoaD/ThiS family protein [Anaerolineales bacterium]|nr:MoaD/ThiS family protein [Anaerolineales bacterium]
MRITVRLHTILRRETPEGIIDRISLDLPAMTTVSEAIRRIELPIRPRTMLLVVNGKLVQEDHVLGEGDELRLVPGVSGGRADRVAEAGGPALGPDRGREGNAG